jgi:peptide/nickel transport system permease protein
MTYLAYRVCRLVLLLLGASVLCFLLFDLAPGDYLSEMRLNPQVSVETIGALRTEYGLDRSFVERYSHWLSSVAAGTWGYSFAYNCPVSDLLWERARNTLYLTVTAMGITWPVAIVLGTCSAASQRRGWARILGDGLIVLLVAIPDLLLALLFQLFAVRTGLLPTGGMVSVEFNTMDTWRKVGDLAAHLCLPVLCLSASHLPYVVAHVQTTVADVLNTPFLRAAVGLGIARRRLLFRHALPAALNPLISLFGLSIGALLSSSLLVEAVMGWPGLGRLMLESILARDAYVVIGTTVSSTLFAGIGSLIADALLRMNDPRIREGTV